MIPKANTSSVRLACLMDHMDQDQFDNETMDDASSKIEIF